MVSITYTASYGHSAAQRKRNRTADANAPCRQALAPDTSAEHEAAALAALFAEDRFIF